MENLLDQSRAPIYEALENFRHMRVVPFDVPGHKHGRGNPELTAFLGEQCVGIDVNSMKPLDNLCHPVSVIRQAEELAADAFGAAHAFLMVGGTTSSVQSMVLSCCKRGDKIILPRNVHRSVINALVLCGAIPVGRLTLFTLAMIQMRVNFHQPEANLNRAAHLVAQAAADGAQQCILPECMDLGWGTPEALQLAQPIPGAVSQRLCQIARENGVWLVSGLTENVGDRVYNAALLISDQGEILLHHRKINVLTGVEDVYAIGDRLAVGDTPFGRIGIDICAWRINREQSYKSKQRKVSKIKGFRLLIRSRQEAETHFAPYLLPTDSSPGLCRKTGGESSSFPCRQLTESGL